MGIGCIVSTQSVCSFDQDMSCQNTHRPSVCVHATGVFQNALKGGVSNLSFGNLSGELGRTMYKYSFRIPPYYTLLVRSLSVLEGIALASDRNYKVEGGERET